MAKIEYEWCVLIKEGESWCDAECVFFDNIGGVVGFLMGNEDLLVRRRVGARLRRWCSEEWGDAYIIDGKIEPMFQYSLRKDAKVPVKFVKQVEKHEELLSGLTYCDS